VSDITLHATCSVAKLDCLAYNEREKYTWDDKILEYARLGDTPDEERNISHTGIKRQNKRKVGRPKKKAGISEEGSNNKDGTISYLDFLRNQREITQSARRKEALRRNKGKNKGVKEKT
jgi:hypothetical protein